MMPFVNTVNCCKLSLWVKKEKGGACNEAIGLLLLDLTDKICRICCLSSWWCCCVCTDDFNSCRTERMRNVLCLPQVRRLTDLNSKQQPWQFPCLIFVFCPPKGKCASSTTGHSTKGFNWHWEAHQETPGVTTPTLESFHLILTDRYYHSRTAKKPTTLQTVTSEASTSTSSPEPELHNLSKLTDDADTAAAPQLFSAGEAVQSFIISWEESGCFSTTCLYREEEVNLSD